MATVHEASAKSSGFHHQLIKMQAGIVLIQFRGQGVVGVADGHAGWVIDAFAHLVVVP